MPAIYRSPLIHVFLILPGLVCGYGAEVRAAFLPADAFRPAFTVPTAPLTELARRIRFHVEQKGVAGQDLTAAERDTVKRYYGERHFHPLWSDEAGFRPGLKPFFELLENADDWGLDRQVFDPVLALRRTVFEAASADELARMDVALTRAALLYARQARAGRVRPRRVSRLMDIPPKTIDTGAVLDAVRQQEGLSGFLLGLHPKSPGFQRLRAAYRRYVTIVRHGGWPRVRPGRGLRPGRSDPAVVLLRQRLSASGDLAKAAVNGSALYDKDVEEAVRAFQLRYGLKADGRLGRNTLAVLNVPARTRLAQIIVNMERRRWLPDELGKRHVVVNQAEFRLHVVENGQEIYSSRVVVGKPSNQTPEFSNSIKLVVLNPYWGVPRSIATKEILPILRRNPGYLARKNMVLVGRNGKAVNPASVNWNAVSRAGFRYGIRQRPGAGNALGRIKFLFPNKHSVYLHDTPSKSLFSRFRRAFSHGCVRVQNPVRFAEVLMKPQFGWSRDAIKARIAKRRNQTIRLKTPVPIHLTYQTAWVDARGKVHFRADIYGRDARLRKALQLPAMVTRLAQLLSTGKTAE